MKNNYTFIDGQNLHMGTSKNSEDSWELDLSRFKVYLEKKFNSVKNFYYLGYVQEGDKAQKLYEDIQSAGFILVFRQHGKTIISKKKGNVDSDIIFNIMKRLYKKENFDKVILVSGDGDYKNLVDFLIEENKFEKILFPNKKYSSSLYKKISNRYYVNLDDGDIKKKIAKKPYTQKEKGALGS